MRSLIRLYLSRVYLRQVRYGKLAVKLCMFYLSCLRSLNPNPIPKSGFHTHKTYFKIQHISGLLGFGLRSFLSSDELDPEDECPELLPPDESDFCFLSELAEELPPEDDESESEVFLFPPRSTRLDIPLPTSSVVGVLAEFPLLIC